MKLGMRIASHARHGIWRRSCNYIEGLFRAFATGSVSPFTMVFSSPKLLFVTNPNGICEIRSHAIRIVSVVIVGVAVGVDIAEIVVVVVIRGTLPPIRSRTLASQNTDGTITETHPKMIIRPTLCRTVSFAYEAYPYRS